MIEFKQKTLEFLGYYISGFAAVTFGSLTFFEVIIHIEKSMWIALCAVINIALAFYLVRS